MLWISKEPCGCEVYTHDNQRVEMVYCPKHKSAPDLYEALKEITTQFGLVDKLYTKDHTIISKAEDALAKAENKQ